MINKNYTVILPSLNSALKYMVVEKRLPLENSNTDTDFKNRDAL